MPEGHAIHRLAGVIQQRLAGDALRVCSPQGRFAAHAARVDGHTLLRAEAYGKHLLLAFDNDRWIHVHFGIFGRLTIATPPVRPPIGQVRMRLIGARAWADLRGPAVCEVIDDAARVAILDGLGPDPLRPGSDPDLAWRRIQSSRAPLAGLLINQAVVAGVGNIYRAEVLFRHGVDPMLPGRDLPEPVWAAIWCTLVDLMRAGVHDGRIDTVDPSHSPAATGREPRHDRHGGEVYVYRRAGQPCHVCRTPIATRVLVGRNLFWCPTCQPPGSRGRV